MNEIERMREYYKSSKLLKIITPISLTEKLFKLTRGGCLYIMQLGDTDVFKIGVSVDPQRRLKQLQSRSPIPLNLIYANYGHDYEHLEKHLHYKHRNQRIKGEWFKLTLDDLLWIMSTYPIEYYEFPSRN